MQVLDIPAVVPFVETAPITDAPRVRWRLSTRIAVRFCTLYFGLYVVSTQMLGTLLMLPVVDVPELGGLPPLRNLVQWTATHVFGVTRPLVITGSGSGDKTFDWVLAFCVLIAAAVATAVWSYAGRHRMHYTGLHKWLRLFVRFSLGTTLVSYGMVKAVPLQMPAPSLARLLEPFGHFSPMGVIWASIGASRSYEIFAGCAELAAGILLLIPRTATLGAVAALAVMIQVFTLNMTYDVPVKLFSFHLILMALFLLAPDAKRLLNVLVLNRPAGVSTIPPLGGSARAVRIGVIAQIVFALYAIGMNGYNARTAWSTYGGGAAKSALYGIWDVDYMAINGVERPALLIDSDRWRRVLLERPTGITFQRMDDTFARYGAKLDTDAKTLTLTFGQPPLPRGTFTFDRPAPDRLVLAGQLEGRKMEMRLTLFDHAKLTLVSRGFHWVQEYPFNR